MIISLCYSPEFSDLCEMLEEDYGFSEEESVKVAKRIMRDIFIDIDSETGRILSLNGKEIS